MPKVALDRRQPIRHRMLHHFDIKNMSQLSFMVVINNNNAVMKPVSGFKVIVKGIRATKRHRSGEQRGVLGPRSKSR